MMLLDPTRCTEVTEMKLYDTVPTPITGARFAQVAVSPESRWTLAVDADQRNLMVLYHAPGWERPGILQAWSCARPKHAEAGFRALKRLFRDLDERAPVDAIARRLPRTEAAFPRRAS